jgi:hypothetical protein
MSRLVSLVKPYIARVLAALICVAALALYVRTGAPTLLTGDQAEHQMTAHLVGVPHATGYPLFTMLNALAVRVVPVGDVARRVTLMTALWSALAVMMASLVARRLSGSVLAGALAAANLAVSAEFWSLATLAEVYTLQALLILTVWWCLLHWWESAAPRWLYAAAFCTGLAVTHHGSFVPIVVPAILFTAALPLLWRLWAGPHSSRVALVATSTGRPECAMAGESRAVIWRSIAWGVLGLAPWSYLAFQFALFQPFDYYRGQDLPYHYYWGNPANWGDVVNLALGAGFRQKVFSHGWADLLDLSRAFLRTLRQEFWWSGLFLGGWGALVLLWRGSRSAVFSGVVFVSAALFGINVAGDVPKAHVYYLPAYVIWSVWAGVGAQGLVGFLDHAGRKDQVERSEQRRALSRWLAQLFLLALIVLSMLLGWRRFERLDRAQDTAPRAFAEAVLAMVEPDAVILCRWEECMPLRYIQFVEQQRLDVLTDQTEPEAGSNWAERAALYAAQRPVYAIGFNADLAARYAIYPISESYNLWQVRGPLQ